MHLRRSVLAVTVVVALAPVVAGCTSPSSSGASVPTGTASAQQASGAPLPSLRTPLEGDTPFTAYYADAQAIVAHPDADAGAARAHHDAVENETASCMKDAGFQYEPTAYVAPDDTLPWDASSLQLPQLAAVRADVERWGYGVDDVDAREADRRKVEANDSNNTYLASLSPNAQNAYSLALTGQQGVDGDPEADPAGGCAGRASANHPDPADSSAQASLAAQYGQLTAAMGGVLVRQLRTDPRTVALNKGWAACMAGAGVEIELPEGAKAAPNPVDAYFQAVRTPREGRAQLAADGTSPEDIAIDRRYLVGSPAETAIAVADFDCRTSTDYVATLSSVLRDLESAFVSSHQHELGEMTASVALG